MINFLTKSPTREYLVIPLVSIFFILDFFIPFIRPVFLVVAIIGSLPVLFRSLSSIWQKRMTIDTFNLFALVVSFSIQNIRSAGFIVLMLTFADLLDFRTSSQTSDAVKELLKLKPTIAFHELENSIEEIPTELVQKGDVLVVKAGSRIPVDGVIVYGTAFINESSVTGESKLIEKIVGDKVVSSTLNESGIIKIRATEVGKDSTIERMASLIKEASKNKSRAEKLADKFASIFLPVVLVLAALTYYFSRNISMTAALFLVACADDMSVAIPLAMTASLGRAAKRGVIIKGGEWLSVLAKTKIVVLDKTGTLTYGSFVIKEAEIFTKSDEKYFWQMVGTAEKYSEHPIGRVIYHQANKKIENIPDPDEYKTYKGTGVWACFQGKIIAIGNEDLFEQIGIKIPKEIKDLFLEKSKKFSETVVAVFVDCEFAGFIRIADIPREEAAESIKRMRGLGVEKIIMLTGDNEIVAREISKSLDISEVRASMVPDEKLKVIEEISNDGFVAMVGDGVNDAPSLARANIGIAMGSVGTAVSVEAADMVILTDDLNRIPEMIELGRKTVSVINLGMVIWFVSNMIGFVLVLTGIAGPALAAFYNFVTDFFPLMNASRLFKGSK